MERGRSLLGKILGVPASLLLEVRCDGDKGGLRTEDDLEAVVTEADLALLLSSPSSALLSFLRSATEETRTGAAASG